MSVEVVPDERHKARYDELYAAYTELYPATQPQIHALAVLQERSGLDLS